MAGKTYIKTGNYSWDKVKRIYLKTGGQTWSPIRKAYIKTGASTWRKVYDTTSNRPFITGNDIPKIRLNTPRTNSTLDFSGTANDPVNPVVEAPPVQQMGPPTTTPTTGWPNETIGNHLWGYDGTWASGNGSAITYSRQWLYNYSGNANDNTFDPAANLSSTGRDDMLTNTQTYIGQSYNGVPGGYFDRNFLSFRVTATNSAGSVSSESAMVYIVKQRPTGSITMIDPDIATPNTTMAASFSISNNWYKTVERDKSYIEWFAADNLGDTLTTSNRVQIEYLDTFSYPENTETATSLTSTSYHVPTLTNKYYYARITLNNSNTLPAEYNGNVINVSGFTPNSAQTYTANKTGKTSAANGPFNLTNATKTTRYYDTNSSTWKRSVSVDIGQSSGATQYEVQVEGQYAGITSGTYDYTSSAWVVIQTLNVAPYVYETSRIGGTLTYSYTAGNYLNYRFTARSRNGTSLNGAAYSNNGTSSSYVYVTAPSVAPSAPSISNIQTSSDFQGSYVTFDNYMASYGSNDWRSFEYSLDNGSNWLGTSSNSGYINTTSGKLYVTAGQTVNLRIRLINEDIVTGPQSNLLTIVAASVPGEPTSVVVKSFNGNQGTIFFVSGANTQSVQGYLEWDTFNDFDSITNYVNVGSNTAAKIQLVGAVSTTKVYNVLLRPYSGQNQTGGNGAVKLFTTKVLNGSDSMQVSLGTPTRPSDRTISLSWTVASGAPTHYICRLYNYSTGTLVSTKVISYTSTNVSFNSSDGVQYSTLYYISVQPQYQYTSSVTYEDYIFTSSNINSGANLTGASSTSIVSMSRLDNSTVRAYIGSSGASGPYYQLFWTSATNAPIPEDRYDAASNTSTVMEDYSFGAATYYFYIRSSNENLGNTTTNGTGTAGTYSDYGPSTGAASYTFTAPSGGTASVSGSSSVGSTLTLSLGTPSASPAADGLTIIWRRNDGGPGGNSYTGGSIMQYGGTSYTIDSPLVAYSSVGYSIRAEVTWNNGVGSQSANSNGTLVTSAGVAPSGGAVTLTPSGTQMAGTTISANVTAMSGTATISYTTTIRKKTGSAPTSKTDGTEVASGTGTGNGVATHTITDSEAAGTPDQFRAFTTGTNSIGSNVVSSNTIISTPYVAPVVTPSGGTATSTPSTGTAGTTTYVGSTSGWSGSPTSYTYSWQYFSQSSFSWVQYTSGTSFSPPSNINSLYPNYGWQLSVGATNSAGTGYATTSITVNTPTVVTAPSTPTGVTVSGSGLVSWDAVSGATTYEVLNYTDRTSAPSNTTNRLGPYTTTGITGTSYQLGSTEGYSGSNNYARAQVRARNSAGVSTYSAWYPSSTTYV
jgi:hypothetical protein